MRKFNVTYGQSTPQPSPVRGAGFDIDGGFSSRRMRGVNNPATGKPVGRHGGVSKSKKAYTGTVAGIGRATGMQHVSVIRNGPGGPSRFPGAVQLPNRGGIRADQNFSFNPAPRPSLMTRIGRKLRFGRGA